MAEHADRAAAERLGRVAYETWERELTRLRPELSLSWDQISDMEREALVLAAQAVLAAARPACDHDHAEDEAEFQRLVTALQTAERERDEARRENERLRETLEVIARRAPAGPPPGRDRDGWYTLAVTLAWAARDALAPPEAAPGG